MAPKLHIQLYHVMNRGAHSLATWPKSHAFKVALASRLRKQYPRFPIGSVLMQTHPTPYSQFESDPAELRHQALPRPRPSPLLVLALAVASTFLNSATAAEPRLLNGHTNEITALAFSPDGRTLASLAFDNTIRLWDPITAAERLKISEQLPPRSAVFSTDGKLLITGRPDFWDAQTGKRLKQLSTASSYLIALSPDGRRVVTCMDAGAAIWELSSGSLARKLTLPPGSPPVWHAMFLAGGKLVGCHPNAGPILLIDANNGSLVGKLGMSETTAVAASVDTRLLAATDARTLSIYDSETQKELVSTKAWGCRNLAFSRDGRMLAAQLQDTRRPVVLLDSATGKELWTIARLPYPGNIKALAFAPDGQLLAIGIGNSVVLMPVEIPPNR